MVYKRVLLVFFSTFNVVFNEPFCFSALICFKEPFYISALVNFSTSVNLFALVVQCGVLGFCVSLFFYYVFFYSIFHELVCFSAPTCFNEAFYLFASINFFVSLSCGLRGFCVGFLFYSNVVLSEPLCFNDLFFASNNLFTFLLNEFL